MKMNKYQDALNRLVDDDYDFPHDYYEEDKAVAKERDIETLQELVDKEISQKPTDVYKRCPNCYHKVGWNYFADKKIKRCSECGQSLDWSEDEDE